MTQYQFGEPEFTGTRLERWPNGALKYRGEFNNDVPVGQHVAYWENGVIAQVVWYNAQGIPVGATVSFYEDGQKEFEERRDDDEPSRGTYVRLSYSAEGEIMSRSSFVDFRVVESWESPSSILDEEDEAMIDRIVAEAIADVEKHVLGDDDSEDDE
jgi:antitoxin component YwqK of YwqJK toxin-antitoxin module